MEAQSGQTGRRHWVERDFRRPSAIPRPRRAGLSSWRWQSHQWSREYRRVLLQRSYLARNLRCRGFAACQQSRIQPRSRSGLGSRPSLPSGILNALLLYNNTTPERNVVFDLLRGRLWIGIVPGRTGVLLPVHLDIVIAGCAFPWTDRVVVVRPEVFTLYGVGREVLVTLYFNC